LFQKRACPLDGLRVVAGSLTAPAAACSFSLARRQTSAIQEPTLEKPAAFARFFHSMTSSGEFR
jgi:hypothetical protein